MPLKDRTILIVDDEVDIREVLVERFRLIGSEAVGADSVSEAFSILEQRRVDGVITDLRMGKASGVELLRRLRERDPAYPPVVFATGYPTISLDEAYDVGAEAMLLKPFKFDQLFGVLESALLPLEVRWARKLDSRHIDGTIELKNAKVAVGRGGFFVHDESELVGAGSRVSFEVQAADPAVPALKGIGHVRWVRDFAADGLERGMGVEFESLQPESIKAVLAWLSKANPRAFIPKTA